MSTSSTPTYIGDRFVGKTHLVVELANPNGKFVNVSLNNNSYEYSYKYLREFCLNKDGTAKPTEKIEKNHLNVQVKLPTGKSQIPVDWIDSPGEMFRPGSTITLMNGIASWRRPAKVREFF